MLTAWEGGQLLELDTMSLPPPPTLLSASMFRQTEAGIEGERQDGAALQEEDRRRTEQVWLNIPQDEKEQSFSGSLTRWCKYWFFFFFFLYFFSTHPSEQDGAIHAFITQPAILIWHPAPFFPSFLALSCCQHIDCKFCNTPVPNKENAVCSGGSTQRQQGAVVCVLVSDS